MKSILALFILFILCVNVESKLEADSTTIFKLHPHLEKLRGKFSGNEAHKSDGKYMFAMTVNKHMASTLIDVDPIISNAIIRHIKEISHTHAGFALCIEPSSLPQHVAVNAYSYMIGRFKRTSETFYRKSGKRQEPMATWVDQFIDACGDDGSECVKGRPHGILNQLLTLIHKWSCKIAWPNDARSVRLDQYIDVITKEVAELEEARIKVEL